MFIAQSVDSVQWADCTLADGYPAPSTSILGIILIESDGEAPIMEFLEMWEHFYCNYSQVHSEPDC